MQEILIGSYILRVLIFKQKKRYSLHDLRTGKVQTFGSARAILDHLENLTMKHPP